MKKPTGASTPPTDGIERITSAGTPLADEATEERPPVKRPRSPPSNLVVAEPLPPIADSDDDSLAKKRRLESGTPPPPAYRTRENLEDLQRMASNFKLNRNLPSSIFSKCRYPCSKIKFEK